MTNERAGGARRPEDLAPALQEAWEQADLDAVVSLYAPDAAVCLASGRTAAGRVAIRAAFAAALAQGYAVVVGAEVSALLAGTTACVSDTDGEGVMRSQIARRGEDGVWRWVQDSSRLASLCPTAAPVRSGSLVPVEQVLPAAS